jgi:hypothetical protein
VFDRLQRAGERDGKLYRRVVRLRLRQRFSQLWRGLREHHVRARLRIRLHGVQRACEREPHVQRNDLRLRLQQRLPRLQWNVSQQHLDPVVR